MISCSSCLASSQPATSLNVTLGELSWSTRALVFPNLSAALPPDCIWRMMNIQAPKKMMSGSQVNSTESQLTPAVWTWISIPGLVFHTRSGRLASGPIGPTSTLARNALNEMSREPTRSVLSFLSSPVTVFSRIWRLRMLPRSTSWMKRVYETSWRCDGIRSSRRMR